MTEKTCERCGVGMSGASPRRRFCSDACRAAAHRTNANANANATANATTDIPDVLTEPGAARAGLDDWLELNGMDLPEALTAACRVLAGEVDASPRNSPLWGRYLDALRQLVEAHQGVAARYQPEVAAFQREMMSFDAAEAYRVERVQAATTDAERQRWGKLVPIGCVRGEHRWHTWPAGQTACLDCGLAPEGTPS